MLRQPSLCRARKSSSGGGVLTNKFEHLKIRFPQVQTPLAATFLPRDVLGPTPSGYGRVRVPANGEAPNPVDLACGLYGGKGASGNIEAVGDETEQSAFGDVI